MKRDSVRQPRQSVLTQTQIRLISRRPHAEQKAIAFIRCLAGDGTARAEGRRAITAAGGDAHTIGILARLIGIALHANLHIQSPDTAYISGDEQRLLSLIARLQRSSVLEDGAAATSLLSAVREAAGALQKIGLRLPAITMGLNDRT